MIEEKVEAIFNWTVGHIADGYQWVTTVYERHPDGVTIAVGVLLLFWLYRTITA